MKLEYKPEGENNIDNKEEYTNALKQGMTVHEQIMTQTEKMKDKTLKEKLYYFADYYKWPLLAIIVGVIIIVSIIKTIVTGKDYCFVAMLVNSSNVDSEAMSEDFGEYAGLDLNKYDCYINANEVENLAGSNYSDYGVATRFAALLSAGDLDCVVFDSTVFNNKAVNDVFCDISKVLSEEDIKKFEDSFYYMDRAVIKKVNEDIAYDGAYNIERGTYEEQLRDLEYHTDPEAMQDPVPVGIIITDCSMVQKIDSYYELIPVFAITQNTSRIDTAIAFLHYLYDENTEFESMRLYG